MKAMTMAGAGGAVLATHPPKPPLPIAIRRRHRFPAPMFVARAGTPGADETVRDDVAGGSEDPA
jgi:hypothetical protein